MKEKVGWGIWAASGCHREYFVWHFLLHPRFSPFSGVIIHSLDDCWYSWMHVRHATDPQIQSHHPVPRRLYREVWETSMRQLAKRYDITDVGLSKICKKMDILRPPRGYWAKRTNGQRVEKAALPPLSETGCTQITYDKTLQELESVARKRRILKEQRQTEQQKINRLKSELQDWDTSRRIRMYVAMLRSWPNASDPDQAEFLAWAETYAEHLDPTVDFRIEALD